MVKQLLMHMACNNVVVVVFLLVQGVAGGHVVMQCNRPTATVLVNSALGTVVGSEVPASGWQQDLWETSVDLQVQYHSDHVGQC